MAAEFAASGANVAILARDPVALASAQKVIEAAAGGRTAVKVASFSADVSKASDIASAYGQVVAAFGKVDILINNAGTARTMPAEQITDEIWQEDLDLKLFAAIRLTRLVWPAMKEQRWGRIINVLAAAAKAPPPGSAPTTVSRAAGLAFTKVLAGEGAPYGILVNGLLVGRIVSDQIVQMHRAAGGNESLEEFVAKFGASIPVGRMGKPEEFAAMACFLCSELAGFTTGTAINMDGGASPVV